MQQRQFIENPYRPGAGHAPPVMGGRQTELKHFEGLLRQNFVTENVLVTGLRGFGKTVLVDEFRKRAVAQNWLWVGNDLSESAALTEERLCVRILADIAEALCRTGAADTDNISVVPINFNAKGDSDNKATSQHYFEMLQGHFERAPGLASDKLKAAMSITLSLVAASNFNGIVLAYDEAQCLSDHAQRNEFPMSVLVETVSSLQKKDGIAPCLLLLSGLPAVFDALTETRTYTERMFQVLELDRLSRTETSRALLEPLAKLTPPLHPSRELLGKVVDLAGGYPYLIQFFGKELVDKLLENGGVLSSAAFPDQEVVRRLDAGLFAARWNKTTDKQREFLGHIADRPTDCPFDFSARELADLSNGVYSNSQAGQMLLALHERGLVYRSRHGHYAFTVPMSELMIKNRLLSREQMEDSWLADVETEQPAEPDPIYEDIDPSQLEAPQKKRWSWFR